MSRKAAKSPTRGHNLRSTRAKAKTRIDRMRKPPTDLEEQLELCRRELAEAREQQTATSEVLQVISSSPGELEPVFQAMLEKAVSICAAKFGTLYLCEADAFRMVATHNAPPAYLEARTKQFRPRPDAPLGRAASAKQAVQIADIRTTQAYAEGFQPIVEAVELGGYRTILSVPMLKEDELIGAINIMRSWPSGTICPQAIKCVSPRLQAV